jgi:ATP synthase F1 gamma subunit
MILKRQIQSEKENLSSLKGLVEVYEEIAASRMQRVRGAVLQSRQFLEGLLNVYRKAKAAYTKKGMAGTLRRKNGLTVAVLVTANSGLFGDIVEKVFKEFSKFVLEKKPQVVVLGKIGANLVSERLPGVLYNYFDISDEVVDLESFEMIMRYLLQFESIMVFYGQFRSILNQEPVMTSVTGDVMTLQQQIEAEKLAKTLFLFEPSVQDIAVLFEGEILASLFEQTLHESLLAKYASRLQSLDRSQDSINKQFALIARQERNLARLSENRKQLTTFAGKNLWAS